MRICLLADFSGNPDEGMKNVSQNIKERLALRYNILALNSRDTLKKSFVRSIRSFQPEIIHYLHGPTLRSLIILKLAKLLSGNNARTVCSATKPYFSKASRDLLLFLKPDLILTQSLIWEEFFENRGFQVKYIPNGIDTLRFNPATGDEKRKLRKKWGISCDAFVVLHVGHIRRNRNLDIFKRIQALSGVQTVIVGGTTTQTDETLKEELISVGCKVYHQYISHISGLYKEADLYVFPTKYSHVRLPQSYNEIGAVDMPLSVLEAMACNLPVVTTRFGALPRLFDQGGGLHYVEDEEDIIVNVTNFSSENVCRTREKVLPYDWKQIVGRIESEYQQLFH